MSAEELTIGALLKLDLLSQQSTLVLRLHVYQSNEDFTAIVDEALEAVSEQISRNPQHQQNMTENELTNQLINMLFLMGFDASFDTATGGHCDITIKGRKGDTWLGEAKLDGRGISWIWDGFLQLDSRYMPGTPHCRTGGIIMYCYRERIDVFMKDWKQHLETNCHSFKFIACSCNPNSFYTQHNNNRTGNLTTIKHIPISLHFSPKK